MQDLHVYYIGGTTLDLIILLFLHDMTTSTASIILVFDMILFAMRLQLIKS